MVKNSTTYNILGYTQMFWGFSDRDIAIVRALIALMGFVLHYVTVPLEICLRHQLGLRYWSIRTAVLFAIGGYSLFGMVGVFGKVFILLVVGLGGWDAFESWRWERHGMPWRHTMSIGCPWGRGESGFWMWLRRLRLPVTPYWVHRLYEPALCFLAGLVVSRFDPFLGGYLMVGSVALGTKMEMIFSQARNMVRDAQDGRVFSQHMSQAMTASQPPDTAAVFHRARLASVTVHVDTASSTNGDDTPAVSAGTLAGHCPKCKHEISLPRDGAGQVVSCSHCNSRIRLRASKAEERGQRVR